MDPIFFIVLAVLDKLLMCCYCLYLRAERIIEIGGGDSPCNDLSSVSRFNYLFLTSSYLRLLVLPFWTCSYLFLYIGFYAGHPEKLLQGKS